MMVRILVYGHITGVRSAQNADRPLLGSCHNPRKRYGHSGVHGLSGLTSS
ncbi:hypothetical protein [Mycobacterium sp.]